MRLVHHVGRLVVDIARFSVARRNFSLLLVVCVAIAVVTFTVVTQTVAPFTLYPFL